MNDSGFPNPESSGCVLLRNHAARQWLYFEKPVEILCAKRLEDVLPLLGRVDEAGAHGLYAAGFMAYEAAPAFDPAFRTHPRKAELPLAWFGLYEKPNVVALPEARPQPDCACWHPDIHRDSYSAAIERIHGYIAAGDTYQVNFTFRLRARLEEDPWSLFLRLQHAQRAPYGAYLKISDAVICSASPELFFRLSGTEIVCQPMKGTAKRGLMIEDDEACGEALRTSRKNRAENVMIVDMIRNDLGRVADTGSVEVASLFDVQRFPTVWQMTSTVRAQTRAPVSEIMRALFPCASITGAPKVRTMEIIKELEASPRGLYTGCIGFVSPDRRAQFSVAIRTAQVTLPERDAEYGTGGGIVWDSTTEGEYEECLTKTAILREKPRPFQLLETMLWTPEDGIVFEERHIRRLLDSGQFFSFAVDEQCVRARLAEETARFKNGPMRMRLLVSEDGTPEMEASTTSTPFNRFFKPESIEPWRVVLASASVSSADRFLYHKTTRREVYEKARSENPDAADVILWNERGEITESTMANVVVRISGSYFTPPVFCGLLGGVFRAELLAGGEIQERVIMKENLQNAEALYLINSVRGWIPCRLA